MLLNRDEIVSDLDLCDEMVEELKSEIKLVEGEFDLNENEIGLIREKFPTFDIKKIKDLERSHSNLFQNFELKLLKEIIEIIS